MISGKLINIRHFEERDLADSITYNNDPRIRGEYLPFEMVSPQARKKQFAKNGFSTHKEETLVISNKENKLIGIIWHFVSVPYLNAREIGYTLFDTEQRGKGIVSEAVSLLTDYLFNSLHINRLEIRMDTRNIASEKVAIKCGYTKEGVTRQASFSQGQHFDMNVYALLRSEWRENQHD